ncbi:MAG: hypothetical protein FJY67_03680 [Calditrichaeota bacterium]|nr:hypothetical protein [Calditrichota bacterium]
MAIPIATGISASNEVTGFGLDDAVKAAAIDQGAPFNIPFFVKTCNQPTIERIAANHVAAFGRNIEVAKHFITAEMICSP